MIIPLFTLENDERIIEYLNTYKNISTVIFTDENERLSDFVVKFKKIKDMFPDLKYGYYPCKIYEEYIFDWIPIDLPDFIFSYELYISKEFKGEYYGNLCIRISNNAKDIFEEEKIVRNMVNILVTDIIHTGGTINYEKLENIKKIGKKDIYCVLRECEINNFDELKEYFDGFILEITIEKDVKNILDTFFKF